MQPSEEITKVSVSWPSVIHSCFSHLESIVASLPSIQSTDNLHSISDSSSVKEKVNVTDKLKKTPKGHKLTSEKSEQSIPKNNNDNMEMANIRLIQSSCTATSLVSFIINAISCCGPTILSHTDQSALAIDDMNESTDSNTIIQPFSYLDKYLLHVIASLLKSGILTSVDHSEDKRHIVHIQSIVLFLFRTTYLWENIDWIPSVMIQQVCIIMFLLLLSI